MKAGGVVKNPSSLKANSGLIVNEHREVLESLPGGWGLGNQPKVPETRPSRLSLAAGQDPRPGGKTVIATIWLSNHFPQPHELSTVKISFTDEQSEMMKDEVFSLEANSEPTASDKNKHPEVVVMVAVVVDNNTVGADNDGSIIMIRGLMIGLFGSLSCFEIVSPLKRLVLLPSPKYGETKGWDSEKVSSC